jgi:K+-transporting ATPase c subunit
MALTKETVVDKIEVLEMGQVQVRTATRVLEDGVQLSSSFHRHVIEPSTKASGSWADTDISGEDARVQAIANATWTSAVKTAYQEMVDAQAL